METQLEEEFISDVTDEKLEACECGNPECELVDKYKIAGKGYSYIIHYDSRSNEESNIFIKLDMELHEMVKLDIMPVVFNGFCTTNKDFATILKTVIQ